MRTSGREAKARPEAERVERPAAVTRSGDRERSQVARRRRLRQGLVSRLRRGGWRWLRQRFERGAAGRRGQATRSSALLILVAVWGCTLSCTGRETKEATPEVPEDAPMLWIDLPAGIDVSVDGHPHGTTPVSSWAAQPGTVAIELRTPCGTLEVPAFEIADKGASRLDALAVPGLDLATLRIAARRLDGSAVVPEVTANDRSVPLDAKGEALVHACEIRLRVATPDLGGFVEDIDLRVGKTYTRDVVLAPGPDMIRIHGGRFRSGVPAHRRSTWEGPIEGAVGNHNLEIPTFDLDRTEVTAQQFHLCRKSGGCPRTAEQRVMTSFPSDETIDWCTSKVDDGDRAPKPGQEQHPVNCVAKWEAETYCKWVGKRLPTDMEWEFAARSRKPDYAYPWGNDAPGCQDRTNGPMNGCPSSSPAARLVPVCSYPKGNSEQGVCDLQGSVAEFVDFMSFPGRPPLPRAGEHGTPEKDWEYYTTRGTDFAHHRVPEPWEHSIFTGSMSQYASVGFRCARSVRSGEGNGR